MQRAWEASCEAQGQREPGTRAEVYSGRAATGGGHGAEQGRVFPEGHFTRGSDAVRGLYRRRAVACARGGSGGGQGGDEGGAEGGAGGVQPADRREPEAVRLAGQAAAEGGAARPVDSADGAVPGLFRHVAEGVRGGWGRGSSAGRGVGCAGGSAGRAARVWELDGVVRDGVVVPAADGAFLVQVLRVEVEEQLWGQLWGSEDDRDYEARF